MLDNQRIRARVLPFLILFIMSLFFAGYRLFSEAPAAADAQIPNVAVQLVNVNRPLLTYGDWEWRVILIADDRAELPATVDYKAHWCLSGEECSPSNPTFFSELGSGKVTSSSKNSTSSITHQSVNCGVVDVVVLYQGEEVARELMPTGKNCSDETVSTLGEDRGVSTVFDVSIDLFFAVIGLFADIPGDEKEDGIDSPEIPETPPERSPPGSGDVCSGPGADCEEVYRVECTVDGQQGSRVCFKYGSCSAAGPGVNCSWGNGSRCEPCEAGSSVSDPLPDPPAERPSNPVPPPPPDRFKGNITLSCPIQNQTYWGTKWTWIDDIRGHCNPEYFTKVLGADEACSYRGTPYAIDVLGAAGSNLLLPTVNGDTISWKVETPGGSKSNQAIRKFSGVYKGRNLWLQMHHSARGFGPSTGSAVNSNQIAGRICSGSAVCNHVHLEFSIGGAKQEATSHFACPGI